MSHRIARLLAIAVLATQLVAPACASACGNTGEDAQGMARQAITWASSLVEWHSRRRVATAPEGDASVLNLHIRASDELEAARAQFAGGLFPQALTHAKNVEQLLDN